MRSMYKMVAVAVCACVLTAGVVGFAKAAEQPGKELRHVVLFKFKDGAKQEAIDKVVADFKALPTKIKTITHLEWGTDISPEKKSEGFTHAFILTFKAAADRDAYLVDPAHKAFGASLGGVLDKVLVIDFWAQE